MEYIAICDRARVNWEQYLRMPLEIVDDYCTVLEGEALAAQNPPKTSISDAPAGAEMETETEIISFKVSDA